MPCKGFYLQVPARINEVKFYTGKEVQSTLFEKAGIYLLGVQEAQGIQGLQAVNDDLTLSSLYKRLKFSLAQCSIPQDLLPLWAGD